MFFLGVGKDPLNGFLPPFVQLLILGHITGVVGQFLVVLPDVPLYRFDTVFGMGTQMAGGTVDTDVGITPVLPVSIPVRGTVGEYLVLRANHTVIVLVIYILPPLVAALHGLRALISGGQHTSIFKYLFADMRGLVGGIGNNRLCFRKIRCHTVIDFIKCHTIMYISGSNDCLQNKSMLVAGRVGFIGKLPFVLSLHKQATVRIGYAPDHRTQLLFLPPVQLLPGGIVPALLCRNWWLVIVVKGLLSMGLPVCVYLFHQFLGIVSGCRRNLHLHLLLGVGVGFDVGAVHKYCLRRKVAGLRHFLQNPTEYLVGCLLCKAMPEIIAHRGKVRCFLL